MNDNEKYAYAVVLNTLATTASMTSLLPTPFARKMQPLLRNVPIDNEQFNVIMSEMRTYAPELRDLVCESMLNNNNEIPNDIKLLCRVLLMNVYAYMVQTQIQLFHNQVHTIQIGKSILF